MTVKTNGNLRIDAALLEMAQDFRGRVISHETAEKITKRVLRRKNLPKPEGSSS